MHKEIYKKLTDLAEQEDLTTYGKIAPLAGLSMDSDEDRKQMSSLLEEIARHEESKSRPMLTAIVVHSGDDNNPGEGFFTLAKEFGKYEGNRDPFERLKFWVQEVKKVHDYWGK